MMNWRSRPLALFLPIAFLFLPQPEAAWAHQFVPPDNVL
jgi:hypothetical protein